MKEVQEFLADLKKASENDHEAIIKAGEDHLTLSQGTIANLAALDAIKGNPQKTLLEAIKELQGNPTSPRT